MLEPTVDKLDMNQYGWLRGISTVRHSPTLGCLRQRKGKLYTLNLETLRSCRSHCVSHQI